MAYVILGANNVSDLSWNQEPNRVSFLYGNQLFLHPEWDSKTLANDLALIKLSSSVDYNGIFIAKQRKKVLQIIVYHKDDSFNRIHKPDMPTRFR